LGKGGGTVCPRICFSLKTLAERGGETESSLTEGGGGVAPETGPGAEGAQDKKKAKERRKGS